MTSYRTDLRSIARRAMVERGLLPEFSPAAMAELARIQVAATDQRAGIRDLTGLLWASVDNDDSLDLDQLTVAESHADRSVTILVAIADVDALVTKESALDIHAKVNRARSTGAAWKNSRIPKSSAEWCASSFRRRQRSFWTPSADAVS